MATTLSTDSASAPEETAPHSAPRVIAPRARAVLLAFLLCVPVTFAVSNQPGSSGIFSLMVAPVSALLIAILVNAPLRRFLPRLALSQTDLIVIFSVVAVAGSIAGEWSSFNVAGSYALPFHAKWNGTAKDHLLKDLPDALVLKDYAQLKHLEGGGKGWRDVVAHLNIYFPKWCVWAGLIVSLCLAMQCINSLMRGAWCRRERLTFPLIQLPVAMSEGGGSGGMWRSRAMWAAFIVMFSIDILNGLNYLYPNLPSLPTKDLFYIDRAFKDPPLSNIGDFRLSIYPFMAALGLFMPSDLLFSFVVFFLLRKATHVALASQGIPQSTFSGTAISPGPPYFDEQTWGAVIAMFLGALWVSKSYLKEVWGEIRADVRFLFRRGPASPDPEDGGVRHAWSFLGLVGFTGVVVGYGVWGGLPVSYLIPYVGLFLVFSIVLTRIRAQLGPPTHEFAFFGPTALMSRFVGNKWMTDPQISFLSQGYLVMNRIYRNHPMPYGLEAMKMGMTERLSQKRMLQLIIAATVFGFFLAYFFYMVSVYRTGGVGWTDAIPYFERTTANRSGPDVVGIVMTIFGFAVVMVLDIVRFRFPGFPLHPAGYVLSMNYGVDYYWSGLLLALGVKNFVQKYYGLNGYDKLRQVALGILLGEYAAETIWLVMALITKQSTYTISFNDRGLGRQ